MNADASDNGGLESGNEIVEKMQDAGRVFVEEAIKEASGAQTPRHSWAARFSRIDRGGKGEGIARDSQAPESQTPHAHKNRARALLAVVVTAATVLLGVTAVTTANADPTTLSVPVIQSPTDGSTVSSLPTINGNGAVEGDEVTVYVDGVAQSPTATADEYGNWAYTFTNPLRNGSHTFTATESDGAGNVSGASDPITVNAALAVPVIQSPTDGSTVSSLPTINGNGVVAGGEVTVYVDGVAQSPTVTADEYGNWAYTFTNPIPNGSHTVAVSETDSINNTSAQSAPIAITTALAVPVITSPIAGSSVSTLPTISGNGAVEGSAVTVYLDGVAQAPTVTVGEYGNWYYTFTNPLTGGSHTIAASETDSIGNTSAQSAPIAITTALAVPVITSPTDGSVVSPLPTIAGSGAVGSGTVTVFVDGVAQSPTVTAGEYGGWSYQFTSPLSLGSHTFTTSESDALGNVSATSSPVTVTVAQLPDSPTVNPTDGTVVTGTGTPGDTIVITVNDGGTISQVAAPVTVDAEGNWTVTPSSPLPTGTGLYVVDVNSAGISSAPTVVLVGTGIPNVDYSGWALSTSTAAANGTSTITATLHVVGLDGGNVSGLTITPTFTANTSGATASNTFPDGVTVSPVTSTPGLNSYTFTLTSTAQLSGQLGATAVVQGKTYTFNTTGISFVAAPVTTGSNWTLTAPESTSVDGAPSYQVWIELLDASGNRVSGQLNNLTINASGAPVTSFTESSTAGIYVANITSTKAGSFPVTVSLNGDPITEQSNYPTSAVFTTGAASPAVSSLAVTAGAELANGTDTQTATATVTDQYGNPVVGADVDFSLEEASGAGFVVGSGAPTPSATVTTNGSGVATVVLSATTGGTYHVGASLAGTPISGSPAATSFVSGTVDADASSWALGAASPSTDVDASASYPVTISLVGTNGSPVAGAVSDLTVNASGAAVSAVTDSGNGRYTATVSSTKAGSFPVTVSLGSGAAALQIGGTNNAVFTAGAPLATKSALTVSTNAASANGSDIQTASVSILDQFGNPVAGASVDFSLQEASGAGFVVNSAVSPTATVAAGANGVAQVGISASTPGSYHVVAQLGGTAVPGSPAVVSFGSSTVDAANSSWTLGAASTTDVDNNPSYPVTITLKDASGKPVTGAAANISITTTAGSGSTGGAGSVGSTGGAGTAGVGVTVSSVVDNGDGTYTATITGTKAGSFPVSVSLGSGASAQTIAEAITDASGSVVFTPGAVSGTASQFTVTNNPALANGTDTQTATATVTDQYGNPIDNAPVTISTPDAWGVGIVVGNTIETSATVSTNSAGWAQVKISATTGGNYLVTAGVGDTVISGYYQNAQYASFASGVPAATVSEWGLQAPASTDVTTSPAPTYQGSITLRDANGNLVTGAVGDITINASGATVSNLAETSTRGVYWFYISSSKPGAFPVSVSVPDGQIGASTVAVFTAGAAAPAASTVSATHNTALANGSDTQTVSVRVTDQAGNPVNGAPVSFSLQEASGASLVGASGAPVSTVSTTSNWGGGASVAVTATTAGTYHVAVTVNGVAVAGSPVAVTFASGTAVASNSSWTLTVPSSTSVDDSPAYTVTAALKDVNGAPVTGAASYLSINAGGATASPVADNGDGTYTATVTSATAGTYPVTVTVGGTPVNPASGSATSAVFTQGSTTKPNPPSIIIPSANSTVAPLTYVQGFGAAGDTVTLYVDGVAQSPTVSIDQAGNWRYDFTTPLANGSHVFTATQTDASGQVSAASDPVTVTVALPAPTIEIPSNNATVSPLLYVQGQTGAGDVVTVYLDGVAQPAAAPADANGNWSYTFTTALTSGSHVLTATTKDSVGNVSVASDPVTVNVALPAPTILIPSDSSTVSTLPYVQGSGASGDTVTLVVDGVAQAPTATVDANGNWSYYFPTALSDGTHVLTATQEDSVGNVSAASDPVSVTVQAAAPPVAPIVNPSDGSSLTGTAEPGSTVTVRDADDNIVCTVTADPNTGVFQCGFNPTLANGTVLSVTARNAGGTSAATSVTVSTTSVQLATPVITSPWYDLTTSDGLFTVQGTGAPGDTVALLDGGTVVASGIPVGSDGSWSYTPTTPYTVATHTFTATQSDASGNVSQASDEVIVFVASATLPTPTITAPTNGLVTNNTTPLIYGTGVAGGWIAVFDGPTQIASFQINSGGGWYYTPDPLAYGTHTLTVVQSTDHGVSSAVVGPVTFTITQTPVLAAPVITTPVDGLTTNNTRVSVQGTATAGDTVTVSNGSTVLASDLPVASDGTWIYNTLDPYAYGSYAFTATQQDAIGDTSPASNTVNVTVTSNPLLAAPTITSPVDGTVTNATGPQITGTGIPGDTVTVLDGTTVVASLAAVGDDGTWWAYPSTPFAAGTHVLTATQADAAGDQSAVSAPVSFTVSSAPLIAAPVITSPANGSTTNAAQPTLSGTGVAGDVVTLSDGSGPLAPTARVAEDGTWSSVLAPLAAGTYTFTATQADDAGNVSAVSNSVTLTVVLLPVLEPPVISAPVDGTITNNTTPRISGTGVPGDWVALSDGSTVLNSTIQVQADGSWWFTPTAALAYGVHTFTATQTNTSEQVSGVSNTVSVTVTSTPVLAAPVITAPVNGSSTTSTTPMISGTGIAGDTVSVSDGSAVLTSSVTVASDGSWSFTPTTALAVGSHSLTATQSDASGNTSAVSSVVSVTVQAAAPVVPAAPVITSPSSGSTVTTATPVISGTGVAGATVTVSDAAGALTPTVTVGANGTWSLTPSTALANGSYTFTAVQSNANGTSAVSAAVSVTVSVQTAPPSGGGSSGPSLSDIINAIMNVVTTIVKTIVSVVVSIRNIFHW